MERILISACLLGERVRYDGGHNGQSDSRLARWLAEGRLVPVCPESAGGLPTPRPPAEIVEGGGGDVWRGTARVLTHAGVDVADAFCAGGQAALTVAREAGARMAILKARSPSCGSARVHDGTFSGTLVPGEGVTTALLRRNGIAVFNEEQLDEAAAHLARLEQDEAAAPADD